MFGALSIMISTDPVPTLPISSNGLKSQLNSNSSSGAETFEQREGEHQFNHHNSPYACVHEWFEAQVEKTPQAIALSFLGRTLTYQALNERANQLAHYLLDQGLQPQELVAISMHRCFEMVVGIWGVLKAGGAYVPIDPTYPQARQHYMLADSQARFILTQKSLVASIPGDAATVLSLDADWDTVAPYPHNNPAVPGTSEQPAYVIYTSGSTGNPKGVKIPHRGVINHSLAITQAFELNAEDRALQFSSISFDIIVEELFPTLLNGAILVLRTEEISTSIRKFLEFIAAHQITILNLPTAFWHELVNGLSLVKRNFPSSVRLVIVGGEKASRLAYAEWVKQVGHYPRWLNAYGPTETTVTATIYDPIQAQYDPEQGEIPIGKPLAHTEIYILNAELKQVAFGEVGELHIGGPGLAIGYHHLPSRTTDKFIPNPFSDDPQSRLYKTGDLVRYLPDGNLEFMGRIDFQVKIRGFRIELGEIEGCLEKHPSIRQAIAQVHKDGAGDQRLVAYLVTHSTEKFESASVQQFLKTELPEYMIPTAFVLLETLPLTPNGKVDRKALPTPEFQVHLEASDTDVPQDEIEAKLLEIWKETMGLSKIGRQENFFDLGGHSLLIARLCDRIEYHLNQSLPPAAIFQAPTVEQLANLLRHEQKPTISSSMMIIQAGNPATTSPLFCIHVLGKNGQFFHPLVRYLDPAQPVYGLSAQMTDRKNAPPNQIQDLAAFYVQEMRLVQPIGPYYLTGVSFGGEIAFEIAQQLVRQGETIGLLALLDTFGPETTDAKLERASTHVANLVSQGLPYLLNRVQHRWTDIWLNLLYRYNQLNLKLGRELSYEQQFLMILEENKAASKNYRYETYPGKVTLFRATEEVYYAQSYLDAGLGWRDLAGGGVEIHDVPGDHMSMLDEPHVQVLAQKFAACLSKAEDGRCSSLTSDKQFSVSISV
jgi:aspartate racemase